MNIKQVLKTFEKKMNEFILHYDPHADVSVYRCSPLQMVDFVCVLPLLSILLIGFVLQHLHPLTSTRLILTGFSHRVQLANLVLENTEEVDDVLKTALKTSYALNVAC